MHPAVAKAKQIASLAVPNGWTGNLESEPENDYRRTVLSAERLDEQLYVEWRNNALHRAEYYVLGHRVQLSCAKDVMKIVKKYPDVVKMIEIAHKSGYNPVPIVERYRRLPFDWENDPDDEIIAAVKDHQIHWYSHLSGKVHSDVVLPKKKTEIKPVGHRKMLCFIGSQAGFRNVMLDTVLKVG
jgi:hypothetical protein